MVRGYEEKGGRYENRKDVDTNKLNKKTRELRKKCHGKVTSLLIEIGPYGLVGYSANLWRRRGRQDHAKFDPRCRYMTLRRALV